MNAEEFTGAAKETILHEQRIEEILDTGFTESMNQALTTTRTNVEKILDLVDVNVGLASRVRDHLIQAELEASKKPQNFNPEVLGALVIDLLELKTALDSDEQFEALSKDISELSLHQSILIDPPIDIEFL
ncbi:hypothetical protein N9L26_00105 [Candidatus Pacebacteria bacterium]|nr:hypothetical protein [Candidatus Paceibacterota bacterium]